MKTTAKDLAAPCPECKQVAMCDRCRASIARVVENVSRALPYNFKGQLPLRQELT